MPETVVPVLTTEQMRQVDRLMFEVYHVDLIQMMENAGRNLASLARRMLEEDVVDRPIVVLAGRGNNGGGGLVAARHLRNWGAWVHVLCTHAVDDNSGVTGHQLSTLQAMDVPVSWADEGWELPPSDLIVDAIIGYGLRGAPHGRARELILLANSSLAPILSLDTPSGVDAGEGILFDPHVQASTTMMLALPKRGLIAGSARIACGELYLADIGVPPELFERLGIEIEPLFSAGAIVPLRVVDDLGLLVDPGSAMC